MRRHPLLVIAVLVAALAFPLTAGAQPSGMLLKKPEVPYVPTPERVVDEMLKVAEVKPTDILYDLGSGDGRIVITAAKRYGARGVGIDIDPQRVYEANKKARKAKVTEQVRFLQADIFEADFSEATVVTMYLLQDVNLRLRPKLLSQLRPGTRIVSHNYDLGDWAPLQTISVKDGNGQLHTVYYWVVPARAAQPD